MFCYHYINLQVTTLEFDSWKNENEALEKIRKVWRSMGQPGCLGIFNYQGWCIFESVVCRSCHHIHNCYINHYKPSSCHGNPLYVRRSKLNSCGEVMASLHKAPYHYTQSQHPFHQLGRIAARRRGSRWGIGFLFLLRRYLQGNSDFYVVTKADVDSFS